jgi:ADP-heptose:LPS heptosyltransferase
MQRFRVAVPPGIGDIYWCLTKLKALREQVGAEHVELCVQRAGPGRSILWAQMVDFVDSASMHPFTPGQAAQTGYLAPGAGVDCILWPNAIVDQGRPLSAWLPHLQMDLDFPIHTQSMGAPRVLLYASSEAINRAWVPNLGLDYWAELLDQLTRAIGPVTLIGAAWDETFTRQLRARIKVPFEDLGAQTSLPQVADLLKNARVLVGVISGLTILANHFRTPTVALYPQAHHPNFPVAWVAPDAPYAPILAPAAPSACELAVIAASLARPE